MFYNLTQIKGLTTELQCISKFIELGFIVSIPYGNGARYDFLVDTGKRFFKMQVKTANKESNSYKISLYSCYSSTNKRGHNTYSKEDVDFFITIIENNLIIVPIEECGSTTIRFRSEISKSPNIKSHYLDDYSIEKKFFSILTLEEIPKIKDPFENIRSTKDICPICGGPKSTIAKICQNCISNQATKKANQQVNREELKNEIRIMSLDKVAKIHNVSKGKVKNWCVQLNLPFLKRDINSYSDEEWIKI